MSGIYVLEKKYLRNDMELISSILYNLTQVHPFHALVVHFPIALTGAALFFLLLGLWRRSALLEQVAFANIVLAMISTLAAGITGWLDNNNIYDGAAPNSGVKIVLATILFIVTFWISVARWRKPDLIHSSARFFYVGGYFVSFALVSVLGFLGGIILYGFHEVPTVPVTGSDTQTVAVNDPASYPTATAISIISFSNDILPIMKSRCINCHGGQKMEEGLDLTSYATIMAGSENGPVILIGDPQNSPLVKALLDGEMPKRGPKLKPEQTQLIIDWIDAGYPDN